MKNFAVLGLIISCLVLFTYDSPGQINWKKKLQKQADKTVDKGIEEAEKEAYGKEKKTSYKVDGKEQQAASDAEVPADENVGLSQEEEQLRAYSKYNFVPGDVVIFEDNLMGEENGEFPSKWDLKEGNVEIAKYGNDYVINFPTTSWATIVPLMSETGDYLPEKFTIEFDAYFSEFCTKYRILFYDMVNQQRTQGFPDVSISPEHVYVDGYGSANIETPRDAYPFWQRIAISFNIRSLKVYFGEQRTTNIPNLKAEPTGITIKSGQCHAGTQAMIKNIRIAKGSTKLYDRVGTDGKFVTNGIRFDVGKASIRPESMGVINQIYKMMEEYPELKFSVEGHTDSDGNEESNLILSAERASSVVAKLSAMGIAADRFESKGFGEGNPIDANNTPEGKANNRRVEFIKI